MPDFNKPQPVNPLREARNKLALEIEQGIKTLVREHGDDGEVQFDSADQFEIEGHDDMVVAVVEEQFNDESGTSTVSIITEYDGEETSNDIGDMSIEDMLNVYEALKAL